MKKFQYIDSGGAPELEYLQVTPDNGTAASYTFPSQNLGEADASRIIVVFIRGYRDAGGTISSVTIGGVAATIHLNNSIGDGSTATVSAVVPTGTSGDIVVNWGLTQAGCTIITYSIVGAGNTTPEFAIADTTTPLSITPTISGETAVLAFAGTRSSTATWVWSGTLDVIEDSEQAGDSRSVSSASLLTSDTGNIIATPSVSSARALHVIGFK